MNDRAFRYPSMPMLVFALLLALPGFAATDEGPRAAARAAFSAVAPPQAAGCGRCRMIHKACFDTCFGTEGKSTIGTCLTACGNAAATCTCDEEFTLTLH